MRLSDGFFQDILRDLGHPSYYYHLVYTLNLLFNIFRFDYESKEGTVCEKFL